MDIKFVKGKPYFCDTKNYIKRYNHLDNNLKCQVLVIGGGINGAICLYQLAKAGIDCVLIEKNRLGILSTACATSLLEYQLDDLGAELLDYTSKVNIIRSYKYGLESLKMIDEFINKHGNKCEYNRRDTLIYTLKNSEIDEIKKEYNFRYENGFDVEYFDSSNNPYKFDLKAGLYSKNGGADFNSYLFTKQLIEEAEKLGGKIFENTAAEQIIYKDNCVNVRTDSGYVITADKIICSTGYNTTMFTDKELCEKYITYTIVTNPIENFEWYNKALLQDNSTYYHYVKLTNDNRLVMGGEDVKLHFNYICKTKAFFKYRMLESYIYKIFPELKNKIKIDYKFAGQFAITNDNMGIIGQSEEHKNLWYCLGYGANGIIYAMKGGKMLADLYKGEKDSDLDLFDPSRKLV